MTEFLFGVMIGVLALPFAVVLWLGGSLLIEFLRGKGGWK